MATEKQIHANRNNPKKSTAPRTDEGKSRASQNAIKQGLLARDSVKPGEDPAKFEALFAAHEADIQPEGALECELVRQIADAQWRMRRLTRIETGYLAASLENRRHLDKGPRSEESSYEQETLLLGSCMFCGNLGLVHIARYDAHLGRRFERAIQQIAKLRESREKRPQSPAESALRKPAGTTTAPLHEAEQSPPSENCETNPIPPNQNEISKIAANNPFKPHPPRQDSHRPTPPPHRGRSPENQKTPVKGAPNHQKPHPR
jgi:hypothetical protein